MAFTLSGTVLTKDLYAADGRLVASRGEIIDLDSVKDVASRAPRGARERPLFETPHAEEVLEAFEAPALHHLVGTEETRALAADALVEVRFPQAVWEELEALRREDGRATSTRSGPRSSPRASSATRSAPRRAWRGWSARRCSTTSACGTSRCGCGSSAITSPAPRRWRWRTIRSSARCSSPACSATRRRCTSRCSTIPAPDSGYPRMQGTPPLRGLDVVAVASAFAALVAPRSFRLQPYNPRGAIDQLTDEAEAGHFDRRAVRILIQCLRNLPGGFQELKLPTRHTGFRPPVNHHGVAA